jgi:hypothetical protein
MFKKVLYGLTGLMIGFFLASAFFMPELKAQTWGVGSSTFTETTMKNSIPASYGNLVAIFELGMYFQAQDGTIRIVKPRTGSEFDPNVTVIKRGE